MEDEAFFSSVVFVMAEHYSFSPLVLGYFLVHTLLQQLTFSLLQAKNFSSVKIRARIQFFAGSEYDKMIG